MFTDSTLQPIYDHQFYTAPNGMQYPHSFPKAEIPGLSAVAETARPDNPALIVTGFTINAQHAQVWQTRAKTAEETAHELKNQTLQALAKSDGVAIRCVKAGVAFPAAWQTYVTALRAIMNGASGPLPTQPAFPAGT